MFQELWSLSINLPRLQKVFALVEKISRIDFLFIPKQRESRNLYVSFVKINLGHYENMEKFDAITTGKAGQGRALEKWKFLPYISIKLLLQDSDWKEYILYTVTYEYDIISLRPRPIGLDKLKLFCKLGPTAYKN